MGADCTHKILHGLRSAVIQNWIANPLWLIMALLWVAPVEAQTSPVELAAYRPAHFKVGGEFQLTDQNGERLSSSVLRGKPVLMAFGFTHCPDTCPVTVSTMSLMLKRLQGQARGVHMVFVTVDPERDSPPVLKQYLDFFEGRILGLTGELEQVEDMASVFGVSFRKVNANSAAGYMVNHTSAYYLLDREGSVRYILPHDIDLDLMLAGLKSLLEES